MEDKRNERLIAKDVSLQYEGTQALRGCDVAVASGLATMLVGPSGTGKSTLLWLLAGLLKPDAGRVGVESGSQWNAIPAGELGMVFQQPMLWEHLSAEQHLNLVLAGKGLSRRQRCTHVEAALSRMMLQPLRRRKPGQLSGGERQRLAIARAIVAKPRWLLLDEPLAHLDGPARAELMNLLREVLREMSAGVVLATHNATDALRLGDDICVMLGGKVAQHGPAEEVYRKPVNLDVAKVLGPACLLQGLAREGTLYLKEGNQAVLHNLDATLSGNVSGLLRPDDVRLDFDAAGVAKVIEVEYVGNGYSLRVNVPDGETLLVYSQIRPEVGTAGSLVLSQPAAGLWNRNSD